VENLLLRIEPGRQHTEFRCRRSEFSGRSIELHCRRIEFELYKTECRRG
jgi:hypothetical protein